MGASEVIDYTKQDFTKNGKTYDVIFDTVNKISFSDSIKSLNKNGKLILSASGMTEILRGIWTSKTTDKKVITGIISEKSEDVIFLKVLIEQRKFKPVIDRSYSLEDIVAAHRYVEKGHKRGNVVISLF